MLEWWNNEWWRGVNILQTDSRSKLEALESGSWHEGWEGQIFKQPKRRNVGLPDGLKWNNSVIESMIYKIIIGNHTQSFQTFN